MATQSGSDEGLIKRIDPGDPSQGTNPTITPEQDDIIFDRQAKRDAVVTGPGSRNKISLDEIAFTVMGVPYTWRQLSDFPSMGWIKTGDAARLNANRNRLRLLMLQAAGTTSAGDEERTRFRSRLPIDPTVDPDEGTGSGSGFGRGSGASALTFIPSDLATVTDQVRSYVVAVTGTANEAVIKEGIAAFQSAEKEAFNKRETQTIDAWSAMKNSVRGTSAYKTVNDNRPDSVDEMEWVTGMQAKMRQLGLSAERAEQLGISAATTAAAGEGLRGLGEVAQVGGTGRMLESHRERMKRTASIAAGLL